MKSNPTPAAAHRAALARTAPGDAAGYLLSSFELRSGLEMRALPLSALPIELASELLRLARSWERH